MSPQRTMIKEDLYNIQRLCFKYGKVDLAEWALQSLEVYCIRQEDFYSCLESLHWWDNIRSLSTLRLYSPDDSVSETECKADNQSLHRSLRFIYQMMAKAGYTHPSVTKTLGDWVHND